VTNDLRIARIGGPRFNFSSTPTTRSFPRGEIGILRTWKARGENRAGRLGANKQFFGMRKQDKEAAARLCASLL
jgi:hypothetical protein